MWKCKPTTSNKKFKKKKPQNALIDYYKMTFHSPNIIFKSPDVKKTNVYFTEKTTY